MKTATSFGGKSFIEREAVISTSKRSPSPPVVAKPTKKPRNSTEENKKPAGETASKAQPANRPTRRSPGEFYVFLVLVFLQSFLRATRLQRLLVIIVFSN